MAVQKEFVSNKTTAKSISFPNHRNSIGPVSFPLFFAKRFHNSSKVGLSLIPKSVSSPDGDKAPAPLPFLFLGMNYIFEKILRIVN